MLVVRKTYTLPLPSPFFPFPKVWSGAIDSGTIPSFPLTDLPNLPFPFLQRWGGRGFPINRNQGTGYSIDINTQRSLSYCPNLSPSYNPRRAIFRGRRIFRLIVFPTLRYGMLLRFIRRSVTQRCPGAMHYLPDNQ